MLFQGGRPLSPGNVAKPMGPMTAFILVALGIIGLVSAAGLMSAWLRSVPDKFPWCTGDIPPAGNAIYSTGTCAFGQLPPPGSNFSLSSDGGLSIVSNGASGRVRGLDPKNLLSGAVNGSTVTLDVPVPSSTGGRSLIRNATRNIFYDIASTGLVANSYIGTTVNLHAPLPSTVAGVSDILDAATNQFRGFEGIGDIVTGIGTDTVTIASLSWERSVVGILATVNVDSSIGKIVFSRRWNSNGYEYAQARGGLTFSATNPDVFSQLRLDLNGIVIPTGNPNSWLGPGSITCIYKGLQSGSIAAPILSSSFFAEDDGQPNIVTYVPSSISGGSTQVDCTFEMFYMVLT